MRQQICYVVSKLLNYSQGCRFLFQPIHFQVMMLGKLLTRDSDDKQYIRWYK